MIKHLRGIFRGFETANPVHAPQVVVSVRHLANDTYVPDFEPNWKELQIRCNWIGMYSEWFREEKEYGRAIGEFVSIYI